MSNGEMIRLVQMRTQLGALKLKAKGLRHSSSKSITAQFESLIEQEGRRLGIPQAPKLKR